MKRSVCQIAPLAATILLTACLTISTASAAQAVQPCCVAVNAETGRIIYCDNMDVRCYPASITKVMTAALALDRLNPSDKITITQPVLDATPWDSSGIGLKLGETFTVEEAEYIMLLKSDNAMANAFAIKISGSISKFAGLMNETAKSLGANDTNFVNPSGYYDPNHYSTCRDMALIMENAVTNPAFVKIMGTPSYYLKTGTRDQTLHNDDQMIIAGSPFYTQSVVCGKTGYTDEARHTLVTYAVKDGSRVITVVMRDSRDGKYHNTRNLLDIAFYK